MVAGDMGLLLLASPPVRGRGLKLKVSQGIEQGIESPPVRGRGLKHADFGRDDRPRARSPPVRGRGLKQVARQLVVLLRSRPPCGGAD